MMGLSNGVNPFFQIGKISDYIDYGTITQIKNALKIKKICLIIF